jgi:hypothetical protein
MTNLELQQEWIEFGKNLNETESIKLLNITNEQWNWFGSTMEMIKQNSDFPTPSGTECRKYPRAFFKILAGGKDYIKEFLVKWATQPYEDFAIGCIKGEDVLYDLIGYGVQPLFGDTNYIKK